MFHTATFPDERTARAYARQDHGPEWFFKSLYRDCMGWWRVELTKYAGLARTYSPASE